MAEADPTVEQLRAQIEALQARVRELETAEADRRQIAGVLQESPELLRQTAESLPIVLVCVEAHTNRVLLMIGAVEEIFGYDTETFLSAPDLGAKIIHPEDSVRVYEAYRDGLVAGHPFEIEFRVFRGGTGEVVWIYQRVVPVFKPDGALACQNCFILDISQRKRAEISLRDSEARFRMLSEGALTGIYIFRRDLFLYSNPAMAKVFGYNQDEIVNRLGPLDLVQEEDRPMVLENIRTRLEGEVAAVHYEFRGRRKDGSTVFCEAIGRPIEYQGGAAILGTLVDITSRREAEAALHESERRLRAVVEAVPVVLFAIDRAGVVRLCEGRPVPELAGQPREFVGRNIRDFYPDVPEVMTSFERALAGETFTTTIAIGGQSFEVWLSPTREANGQVTSIIGVANNVTERNRLQTQLLQSQKLQSIGTLAGGVAHDFGNLLAVIIGNLSIVLRQPSLSEKARDLLRDVMNAADRASGLTQQLLAFARGGLQKPCPISLNRQVESVLQILRRAAPRGMEFSLKLPAGLPQVMADPTQMEQVIMNLCLNAVDASQPPATVELSTESVELGREQAAKLDLAPGDYVRLTVRDHGCGMDAATAERVFEPFFTTKPTGRGMGLAATEGIVRSHKGQIRIDSAPGKGTTVSVWLPTASREASREMPQPIATAAELPHGNETVLIIDELEGAARAAESSLSSLGYCVVSHTSLKSAIVFLDTNSEDVDIVLLGTNILHSTRADPLKEIRDRCPEVPLLVAGRSAEDASTKRLLKASGTGFVPKPFTMSSLSQAVRTALDKSLKSRHDPMS